tara:strand:- start:3268 stop:3831 length:564 start_codon:yes stop_codon:yes gene_type:complete
MKKITALLATVLVITTSFAQTEISGVTPEKTIKVGDQTLTFNGAGLREKFFLDLYVGSLYLEAKSTDSKFIMSANSSMAITLDIVSDLITSEKMIDAINEGFKNSTNNNTAALSTKIQSFKDAFKEEIKEGDDFTIYYTKAEGTVVLKNSKKIKSIEGLDFKRALFGIWLCDEPADEDLKEGMLGLD